MKRYTTFEAINRDLKYLRLKHQIELEELKLEVKQGKDSINQVFSPVHLIANTFGPILTNAVVLKLARRLMGGKSKKKKK